MRAKQPKQTRFEKVITVLGENLLLIYFAFICSAALSALVGSGL